MYIIPNSTVEYFGDLGLSPDYSDSLYFASTSAKDAAFSAMGDKLLAYDTNYTYVSKDGKSAIRSSKPISTLHKANYLRFKNTNFENKWFYAFVDEVNYINNGCTEIIFTIDVLMTWMGAFTLGECLVVREHTASDNYGEHRISEGIPTGNYIAYNKEVVQTGAETRVLLVSTSAAVVHAQEQSIVTPAQPTLYNGYMISGGKYSFYTLDAQGLSSFRQDMEALVDDNKVDAIISMHIVPVGMRPIEPTGSVQPARVAPFSSDINMSTKSTIDGYTPKNRKMFTYPYVVCEAINGEGSAQELLYEYFGTGSSYGRPTFEWTGICFDVPEAALIPRYYKGQDINNEECLLMHNFPQASLAIDQYKAWVAQITSSGWIGYASKAASDALTIASDPLSGLTKTAFDAAGVFQEKLKYESLPPAIKGMANVQIMEAAGLHNFTLIHKSITAEYAKMIDDYFTAYGYKVNAVKVPSLNNRPAFTYVQTSGANVHGNLPASDGAKIESILNKGCRFWRNYANIGNLHIANAAQEVDDE